MFLDIKAGRIAYIESNGDLVIKNEAVVKRMALNALPDTRPLADGAERVLLLTDPTERYGHGKVGFVEKRGDDNVLLSIH